MAGVGDIEWYEPYRSNERGPKSLDAMVAHMKGVRLELETTAHKIALYANMELAVHHKTGSAHISIEGSPPHKLDIHVLLKDTDPGGEGKAGANRADRSAMSIEFGWTQTHAFGRRLKKPIRHDGLHILRNAMKAVGG